MRFGHFTTIFLLAIAGCQLSCITSVQFSTLTDNYWAWRLRDSPELATHINNNDYNNQTERFDIDVLDDRKAKVEGYLQDLKSIKQSSLTHLERISYDVLNDTLFTYTAGYKWRYYGPMNPVNFLEGLQNDPGGYIPSTFTSYHDFDDYTERISGWANEAYSMIQRMNKSIEMNTTNNRVSMNAVASRIDKFLGDTITDCELYNPFNEALDNLTLTEDQISTLRRKASESLTELREAYLQVKDFVEEVYLNNTRKEFGVSSFKDGEEYYKACLKWHLSLDMEPEDIHELGLREVARIEKLMKKILKKRHFTGTIREFFDNLNNDSSFILNSSAAVLAKYKEIIYDRIGPKLSKLFKDIPDMPVRVVPMPNDGPGGSYQFGSPDGSRQGVFYANLFRLQDNPTYAMVSLALHEADPGHHMQDIFSQSSEGLPDFRKVVDDTKYFSAPLHFPIYTAYMEGWALYAESLGEPEYLDVFQNDFELMGRYSYEIFRGCRLVVDTGLHYFNWTRDRAIQYVMNYTTMSREASNTEIDRYLTWPGQACAYKIGELKIKELRRHSKAVLGKHFDIRDFHSVILKSGAVPLNVLENLVMEWIEERRRTAKEEFLNQTLSFSELIVQYWQWRLEDAPEFASSILVKNYSAKAEDYSVEVLQQRKDMVDNFLMMLGRIDYSSLTDSDKVSYDVLKDTLQTFSDGYAWKKYGVMNPVNFLEGLLTEPAFYGPGDLKSIEDFDNYISRLYGYASQVDAFIARMQVAFQEKTTNNWVSMNRSLEQFENFINQPVMETDLLKPFIKSLSNSSLSTLDRKMLTQKAEEAMRDLHENYMELKDFIEKEYQPKARNAYGVNSFKNGKEYYKACLKWHLSTDQTPEEIHQLGLDEVTRIHAEMMKVTARLNFTGTIKEFFDNLKSQDRFFLNSSQEIIQRYTDIIFKRVKPKLGMFFKNIPDMPVKVEEMPYDGPGGSYSFGTPDGSKPGVFYVNVKRPKDNPTFDMIALTLHEADPGHHLQDTYAQASASMPVFRRVSDYTKYFAVPVHFPFYTAYTEGWALYAESLGEKEYLNVYQDDYELMGRYSSEIFRACRLVVDTGLHHYNWTRETAIEYMLNYTSYTREAMEVEIDRYITWPGQACAYKVGELKIKELRQKAELDLGEAFDIRDFHSVLLDNGAVPLSVLERLIDDWITKTKSKTDTFEKIANDFYNWRESDNPEYASSYNYKYNDKLTSFKYERFDLQKNKVREFVRRLNAIDKTSLSKETTISYDILNDMLTTFLDGYQWKDYEPSNPFNFLDGIYTDFAYFADRSFDTQGDFVNYVRTLELLSDQFQEIMELTRIAISNGTTNHNVSLDRIPKMLEAITKSEVNSTALYKPFTYHAKRLFGDGPELLHIQVRLVDSLKKLKAKFIETTTFITQEYMPKSRKGLGIGTLPNGRQNYKACLKWHTSLDTSPEKVHQIGLEEVIRIESRIRESMANLSYNSSWTIRELYQHMVSDENFLIATPEETIAHFKTIIYKRIQPKLNHYFRDLPDLPLEVQPTVADGVGGMYVPVAADGSRPGIFYANVHRKEDNPTFTMISLSLHEAIPGHHLAESYSSLSDLPIFRKRMQWSSYNVPYFFPFYNAYVEGWALYSEFLGEEMGIYENHNELLGRFSDEMWRACRLVVDTGIHYFNWTRNDAINYMMNHTAMTYESAAIEVDRYSTWPGQACGYKMGEIKIKELRKKAEVALGKTFNLKDFHYIILKSGPMPLGILERVVDDWIESSKVEKVNQVKFPEGCVNETSRASMLISLKLYTYQMTVIFVIVSTFSF